MLHQSQGYEIEFLPVGNGEKSGDAIVIRYGYPRNYKVMVVDGGTKESGANLVKHINEYYHTNHIDFLVNSHPDADHASGLEVVLEEMSVGEAWFHRPWAYAQYLLAFFKDQRFTATSLYNHLASMFPHSYRLEELALTKNVPMFEPFAGEKIGDFYILSPHQDWYFELIPHFNKTPEPSNSHREAMQHNIDSSDGTRLESWDIETLDECGKTSFENESSTILYGNIEGREILLTGDAGVLALQRAIIFAKARGVNLQNLRFMQVPHHGSRRNVSPSLLDALLGSRTQFETFKNITAFVSSSKHSETHPRKSVVNAFMRRGVHVHATQGSTKRHWHNMPERQGWMSSAPLPFSTRVEA